MTPTETKGGGVAADQIVGPRRGAPKHVGVDFPFLGCGAMSCTGLSLASPYGRSAQCTIHPI